VLPEHLDFAEIRQAPSLHDAPIASAVLAAGTEPQWYGVGEVAVMSPAGSWRIIDRVALGMHDPDIVEQQFELSPDGRTLALGDDHGIVFVDLATADTVRVPNGVSDVVLHWWSPDSSRIVFTPRGSPEKSWEVNVLDRTAVRVDFHAWFSSVGRNGRVSEFVPTASRMGQPLRRARPFTGVRIWQDGAVVREEPLRVGVPINVRVAKHASSLVAVTQWSGDRKQVARGVLALEPGSGRPVGLLRLLQNQTVWATVLGALGERWILLDITSGPGGGIVAWDPVGARLRAVTAIDEQAALVSIAGSRALTR
jgi:hypothetical protein